MKKESRLEKAIREMKELDQNWFGNEFLNEEIRSMDAALDISKGEVKGVHSSATDGEYSYTETDGDISIKLCFKTNVELIAFFNCQKKQ